MRSLFTLLLFVSSLTVNAINPAYRAQEIRQLLDKVDSYTPDETALIKECAAADKNFLTILDEMASGSPISPIAYSQAVEGLINILEKAGMTDDDNYRFALAESMKMTDYAFDYDTFFKRSQQLGDNIELYVKDPILKNKWRLLRESNIPDYLRLNYAWNAEDNIYAAQMLLQDSDITTELDFKLGIIILGGFSNGIAFLEDADGFVNQMRKAAARLYPGNQTVVDDLKILAASGAYFNNPESYSRLVELEMMETKLKNRPLDLISLLGTLSIYYSYSDNIDKSVATAMKAKALADSLVSSSGSLNNPYRIAQAASLVSLSAPYIFTGDTISFFKMMEPVFHSGKSENPQIESRKNRLILFNMRELGSKAIDPLRLIDRYVECLNDETNLPALSSSLAFAGFFIKNHGGEAKGDSLIDVAKRVIVNHPMAESILADISDSDGEYYSHSGRPEEAEDEYAEAIRYYTKHSRTEELLNIYNNLSSGFWMNGDVEKARHYANLYWNERQNSFVPLYLHYNDYNIQRILALSISDANKQIKAFERLAKLCEEKGQIVFLPQCYYALAMIYATNPNLKDARNLAYNNFETAFSLMVDNKLSPTYLADLTSLVTDFADYLNYCGDMKRRSEVIMALTDAAEMAGEDLNLNFIRFLGNQLVIASNNHNIEDALFFMTKTKNLFIKLLNDKRIDGYAKSYMMGLVIPSMTAGLVMSINIVGPDWLTSVGIDAEGWIQMIDDVITDYSSNVSDRDVNYTNLILGKVRFLIALQRLDAASSLLDELAMNPYYKDHYNPKFEDVRDFMPQYRMTIAQCKNDFEELSRLIALPEISQFLDDGASGMNLPTLCDIFFTTENTYAQKGDYSAAMDYARRRHGIVKEFIAEQYAGLSESERTSLIASGNATANDIMRFLPRVASSENCGLAYDASLFFRNLLLESSNSQRRVIYATGDSVLMADYERYIGLRKSLAQDNNDFSGSNQVNRENILASARQLEADIASRCEAFNSLKIRRNTSWKDVAGKLKKDEAAIEFIRSYDPAKGDNQYGALILKKGVKAPEYIPLINESELLRAMEPMKTATRLENGVNRVYRYINNGKILYNQLWKPIDERLNDVSTVYYAPTGLLSTIAFAAIEDSTRAPISSRFNLKMLSSTYQIVSAPKAKENDNLTMAIFGAVKYDADDSKAEERGGEWANLPQSAVEINYVDSLCRSSRRITSMVFSGENASEANFRNISGSSPDMLLMSTHGFYQDAATASTSKFYFNKNISSDSLPNRQIAPLLRGGVILYDANTVWNNEDQRPDETDGVLTALEISGLDLSGTRLAIVSACETGLGEDIGSEGITGLQRGFKLAGVESLVMSLWKVNDAAGSLFMQRFHDKMINSSMERHDAFRATQLELRETYPASPFLWAPFIMLD